MKKIAIGAIIVVAILGGTMFLRKEDKTVTVRTEKISVGTLSSKILLEGVVTPKNEVSVFAEVPTRINKILLTPGSEVSPGTSVAEISAESRVELEKQRDDLNLSISTSEAAIANFDRELNNINFEVTTLGQTLNVNRELLKQDAISSIEVAKSEALFNGAKSKLADFAARKSIENQKLSNLLEKRSEINGKIANIGDAVKATTAGVITEITPKEGELVQKGGKIFTVAELGHYQIKIDAPLQLINILKVGDVAKVKDLSNPNGEVYQGTIESIATVATVDKKNQKVIGVTVDLPSAKGLNIGFATSVEIAGDKDSTTKVVDAFSVITEEDKNYVYVVNSGVVEKIPLEIGLKSGTKYEVINLPEGTEIIVNPFKVKPGDKVKVGE